MAARRLEHGVHYLDAPISGGAVKAANGRLSVMASGSRAAFDAAARVLEATAEQAFDLGDTAGAGSAMKVVNQLLAGIHIAEARGRLLPSYVQREFEEFLTCDRLEHGFPRAGFEECQHGRLVAFSYKRRGL